ncbi:hypothetical protein LGN17_20570 [Burkholderia sp. AU30280]|uniref:hypothetical protein n=1 Tax=Burkholderia sp. AU30280 TaxID=2879628 RepID=UPI001CF14A2E|nr:hypothetical protein [Burkholderia sp. AU30280]MCA8274884.1 hypothetical protein [Burkholderia sp. AU30280]
MELNAWRPWCDGAATVERIAVVERLHAIMSEPGNAFVEAQAPGIGRMNAARRM